MSSKPIREIPTGHVYIHATYNNTIITCADLKGNVLAASSGCRAGFKGPKKSTAYAAGQVTKDVVSRVAPYNMKEAYVFVKGVGSGREASVRALNTNGIIILGVKDITPIPHNGCRPPKPRRI